MHWPLEADTLYNLCDLGETKDEAHFMVYCSMYADVRATLFSKMSISDEFYWLDDNQNWSCVLGRKPFLVAAWDRRQCTCQCLTNVCVFGVL